MLHSLDLGMYKLVYVSVFRAFVFKQRLQSLILLSKSSMEGDGNFHMSCWLDFTVNRTDLGLQFHSPDSTL